MKALGLALMALSTAAMPVKPVTVSAWAEDKRYVAAEAGSPHPGKWSNARVPYAVEIMDELSADPPPEKVVVRGSAQVVKTEIGLNWFGWTVDTDPRPFMFLLPSIEEAQKFNRLKLQPAIDETPCLRGKILDVVSRDGMGSTTTFKRFRGGFAVIAGANSSKALQMYSVPRRVYEEVSEYPPEVGGRGEPTAQADKRALAWTARGSTALYLSTPGLAGSCRITFEYEAGDRRQLYAPCPSCVHYQVLGWDQFRWQSERRPHGAWLVCRAHGCVISADVQSGLIDSARWIKTYPGDANNPAPPEYFPDDELRDHLARGRGGRFPSFTLWQALSPFVPWDATVATFIEAQEKGPTALKAFRQQNEGLPWEERGDAPDAERLVERREGWPAKRIPPGALLLTGATDVQSNRLEWAVYGWDRRLGGYLVDRGIIEGDPNEDRVWLQHDEVWRSTWLDAWGRHRGAERWAIDAGYLSTQVYAYARRHELAGRVLAIDGQHGWGKPAIGTAKKVRYQLEGRRKDAVMLHPVGTWDLKSEIYSRLRLTLDGPSDGVWPAGCLRFPDSCDLPFFQQLTSEYVLDRRDRNNQVNRVWVRKSRQPNEQLDLAVYNLALAHHISDGWKPERWAERSADWVGAPEAIQMDLVQLWSDEVRSVTQAPRLQPVGPSRRARRIGVVGGMAP